MELLTNFISPGEGRGQFYRERKLVLFVFQYLQLTDSQPGQELRPAPTLSTVVAS